MKKWYVSTGSILFAALCLMFTACNRSMTCGGKTGTVRIVLGGETSRAVDAAGMPIFDEHNTKITVSIEGETERIRGTTAIVPFTRPVGTKITVEAAVTTAAGVWRGSAEHTVIAGTNTVAVKLSGAPKGVRNILIDVNATETAVTLKLEGASNAFLSAVPIKNSSPHDVHPVIARDGIGRIYVLYKTDINTSSETTHLRRIDVEGKGGTDTAFETAVTAALLPGVNAISNMAIDSKNNYTFLFKGGDVYCLKEKEDKAFESFGMAPFPHGAVSFNVIAAAVYNDVLFVASENALYACKFAFEDVVGHAGAKHLQFKSPAASRPFGKLRSQPAFGSNSTKCTGLFADENGVYCLLREYQIGSGQLYMVGALDHYVYTSDTDTITRQNRIGLHLQASGTTPSLAYAENSFSCPIAFIGYDENNLYIADDGANIEDVSGTFQVNGNKNRIAVFNRKSGTLTKFENTDAKWYGEAPAYTPPTPPVQPAPPILLWKKNSSGMDYWISTDGTEPLSAENKLDCAIEPQDVFCYDQDGNLYILWRDGLNYKIRRFELQTDGSYGNSVDMAISEKPQAIAVDISGGTNTLYYVVQRYDTQNKPTTWNIDRKVWTDNFSSAGSSMPFVTAVSGELTALAANKDGVFAGIKEPDPSHGTDTYRLKVKRFTKVGGGHAGGSVKVIDNQPVTPPSTNPAHPNYPDTLTVITDLQAVDGVLYAITAKIEKEMKFNVSYGTSGKYRIESFKNGSALYKIGKTEEGFSGDAVELDKKNAADSTTEDPNKGVGYNFYRFIAVRPGKLVIASDGAWGKNGNSTTHVEANNNKVFEYDLDGNLHSPLERTAGGVFSKELQPGSGFDWK